MGKMSWAGDVMTRRLKSTWGATGVSFLSFSKALRVCQSRSMLCQSYLLLFVMLQASNIESSRMSKLRQRQRNIRAKADHVTDCVCKKKIYIVLPAHTAKS